MPAYLVVAHKITDAAKFEEYRTKVGPIIESFGGSSPVIVVLNHSDEHRLDLNEKGLRDKYPGRIRAFVETSCIKPFAQKSGSPGNGCASTVRGRGTTDSCGTTSYSAYAVDERKATR